MIVMIFMIVMIIIIFYDSEVVGEKFELKPVLKKLIFVLIRLSVCPLVILSLITYSERTGDNMWVVNIII